MSSSAHVRVFSLIVGLGLVLFGCSSTAHNGFTCITGQNFACSCAGGVQGVQTCRADNSLGDCGCTQASLVNGTGGSAPVQSGKPGTGGPTPTGTGGMTLPSGGPAGAPGGGGTGGMMLPGGGGGGGGGARPPPGSPYAFCMANGECTAANASCATTPRTSGMVTGYCTQNCLLRECPKPMSGNVTVSCVVGQCTLGSCESADCPDGMNCVQMRMLGQQTFTCQYPSR